MLDVVTGERLLLYKSASEMFAKVYMDAKCPAVFKKQNFHYLSHDLHYASCVEKVVQFVNLMQYNYLCRTPHYIMQSAFKVILGTFSTFWNCFVYF